MIDDEAQQSKFEALYYAHSQTMHHTAMQILHDHQLAEDAVQEALIRVAKNMRKIGEINVPKTRYFLVVIVRNMSLTIAKKAGREIPVEDFDELPNVQVEVEDSILDQIEYDLLLEAMSDIPALYKDVLFLYYVEEWKISEISGILSLPRETVKKRIQRGKKLLLELIEGRNHGGKQVQGSAADVVPQ